MSMEKIIEPIDPRLIEQELTPERFLRNANNGGTQIYRFTAAEAPNAMQELGRLREEAFREAGGGTGKAADIDEFDVGPNSYQQLVVWDPGELPLLRAWARWRSRIDGCYPRAVRVLRPLCARVLAQDHRAGPLVCARALPVVSAAAQESLRAR